MCGDTMDRYFKLIQQLPKTLQPGLLSTIHKQIQLVKEYMEKYNKHKDRVKLIYALMRYKDCPDKFSLNLMVLKKDKKYSNEYVGLGADFKLPQDCKYIALIKIHDAVIDHVKK